MEKDRQKTGSEVVQVGRAVAAGLSVIVAAIGGVVTALVTTHPSLGLWVALGVAAVTGAALQVMVTYDEHGKARRVLASGAASVAVGGSTQQEIRTRVRATHLPATETEKWQGVAASGPGAVGVGGNATGPISTELINDEGSASR